MTKTNGGPYIDATDDEIARALDETNSCNHGPGCCTVCCPAESGSSGTGEGCHVCQPETWREGEAQRDRDARARLAALLRGALYS